MRAEKGDGVDAALKLSYAYAHRHLYIPKKMHATHPLARLLGLERASVLAAQLGGESFEHVPSAAKARLALAILERDGQGKGAAQIARELGCYPSTVRATLKRLRPPASPRVPPGVACAAPEPKRGPATPIRTLGLERPGPQPSRGA